MSGYRIVDAKASGKALEYGAGSLLARIAALENWNEDILRDVFCAYKPSDPLSDPVLKKIRDRIWKAKENGEKVFVAGDYDTDGICATSIMISLLEQLGIQKGYYIPHRFKEGYGLNLQRAMQAAEKGYTLFITVDNGVKCFEALEYLKTKNIDVIILDHHDFEKVPDCYALYHPATAGGDCSWLCGAGCAYQTARCFRLPDESLFKVLAGIAVIGDMVELRGINRWMVKEALRLLNEGKCAPVLKLIGKPGRINENTIAFQVVPKLNAAGRLPQYVNVNQMVRYLTSTDPESISINAAKIIQVNEKRRELTEAVTVDEKELVPGKPVFVYQPELPLGITGLAAMRLCDRYGVPVIAAGYGDGKITGSARSPEGIDVMQALLGIKERFTAMGGHPSAAGMSFKEEDLPFIKEYFENYPFEKKEMTEDVLLVRESDLTFENLKDLFAHGPYGQGVKMPLLCYQCDHLPAGRILKKPEFRRWELTDSVSALTFRYPSVQVKSPDGKVRFIGSPGENEFHGAVSYQLELKQLQAD